MKDGLIIFILIAIVGSLVFTGIITAIRKSMKAAPSIENPEADRLRAQQEDRTRDVQADYKQMMRDNQQKMRDYRSRNR